MQYIPRDDSNIRLMQVVDQMTRTANEQRQTERAQAMQRFAMFRSLGDAKRAAEELNKAQGKGLLYRLFSDNYNRPEDFSVEDRGLAGQMRGSMKPPQEVSMSDKMQVAMQAANQEMAKQGGYGTGLLEEAKTGFGPKARALMEKLPRSAYEREGPIDMQPQGEEYTDAKAAAAQKRIAQVENSQAKYESMKARNMQSSPVSAQATDQYDYYKAQYDAALASGKQGLIKDAYNDMVHKFKLLDNKFGWNMSAGLKELRPTFPSGGGRGAGGGKYYINDLTGERRESSPGTDAKGNLPKGWRRITEATDQAGIKMYEDILKNPDSTPEQIRDAKVRLSRLKGERERKQIVTATPLRGSTGFATGIDYRDGNNDFEFMAAGPNNKNQVAAEPKGKPKLARDERGVMWDISDPKNPKRVK